MRFFAIAEILAVTYNIRHGANISGELDIAATASILAQINPDIIGLQEVDHLRPRSNFIDQAAFLARSLDMEHIFGTTIRYRTGAYGNAILSKFPIKRYVNHLLPSHGERRACLEAEIIIDGKEFTIFNTHLGLDAQERYKQLHDLILPLVMLKNNPTVLCGDFNAADTSEEIKSVAGKLQDTYEQNSGPMVNTYPADDPQIRIDYVFINHFCRCSDYYIVDSSASDHLPAVARIRI